MKFLLTLVFLTPLLAVTAAAECSLTTSDRTAIAGVMEKYRTSWLKSDAAGVLSTFSEDAVLLPVLHRREHHLAVDLVDVDLGDEGQGRHRVPRRTP